MSEIDSILSMKDLKRRGWILRGIKNGESVADHSFSVSALCLLYCPKELNREKVLSIAIIHDLAESVVGDITPYDNVNPDKKLEMEKKAIRSVTSDKSILALFDEYLSQSSGESRFVLTMDKLEMCLQAKRYAFQNKMSSADVNELFIKPSMKFFKGTKFEKMI